MMGRPIAVLFALAALSHSADAQGRDSSRVRTLQYRWVIGENLTSSGYVDPATGLTYQLGDAVVLDIDGIERADVHAFHVAGQSGWSVTVKLTPHAATAFAAATAAHIGQMLAVLMDGHIVSTGVVESTLGSVAGVVTDVSKATADSLARRINALKGGTTPP